MLASASAAAPPRERDKRMERCIEKDLSSAKCHTLMAKESCGRQFQLCCYSVGTKNPAIADGAKCELRQY